MLATNLGDLFSRILARIYSHKSWRFIFSDFSQNIFPQLQAITKIQQNKTTNLVVLHHLFRDNKICGFYRQETNKSWHHHHLYHYHHHQFQNTRFVDFIGKKPTKKPTISSETINITIIIIFTLIISSSSSSTDN